MDYLLMFRDHADEVHLFDAGGGLGALGRAGLPSNQPVREEDLSYGMLVGSDYGDLTFIGRLRVIVDVK